MDIKALRYADKVENDNYNVYLLFKNSNNYIKGLEVCKLQFIPHKDYTTGIIDSDKLLEITDGLTAIKLYNEYKDYNYYIKIKGEER